MAKRFDELSKSNVEGVSRRDVLKMRFGLDDGYARTLEEVGSRLHVTRERVRQIELRALKKLRHFGPAELIRH